MPVALSNTYEECCKRYVKQVKEELKRVAYVRFETVPGRQAQVDFSDFQILHEDGTVETVYCFSMVLGFSRHMYVELVPDCRMAIFLACHMNAFEFFGGVPAELVYDNLKQVVVKYVSARQAKLNATFADFACHYRFKVEACPPYASWCKGKVERPYDYIRESFWRGYAYQELARANKDMHHWLNTVATERTHGTTRQKVSLRFQLEGPHLGDLPRRRYDTAEKFIRQVHKDCLIHFRGNRYVVPHTYVGKKVLVKYQDGQIRIFHDEKMLVDYPEPQVKGEMVQDPSFYEALRADREQNKRKYARPCGKGKARKVGMTVPSPLLEKVSHRELAFYDNMTGGGVCQN